MPQSSVIEVASYIGPICLELKKLAGSANLVMLAYLLEMASLEAAIAETKNVKKQRLRRRKKG